MKTKHSTPNLVVLKGGPRARGQAHGETLRIQITHLIEVWKHALESKYKHDPEELIAKFLKKTDYLPAIQKFTPGIHDEVMGIADGSGVDFNTIFAFQLMDEMLLSLGEISNEHCTSIGVNPLGGKPSYIAQTWDIGGYLDGFQTVLHIRHAESDLQAFVFTYAGLIAAFGMNNKRVAVGVNGMYQLNSSRSGLPVAYVIRGLLEATSLANALVFLQSVPHASPQNYLIAGQGGVHGMECSPNEVTPFANAGYQDLVFHTNHALTNTDFSPLYLEQVKRIGPNALDSDNSHSRLSSLATRLRQSPSDIDVETLKQVLSARDSKEHPICMGYVDDAKIMNLGSTVMVMSDPPEFHIAFGPADTSPFMVHRFE